MTAIVDALAAELSVRPSQVSATVALLDGGATVPFIARYRKEATGGLDDTQLRTLEERLRYLRALEDRRAVILQSIADQGRLTPELEAGIRAAATKTVLEDLYLPYRPKRRTKATIAREAGLEPLADLLLSDPSVAAEGRAAAFVDPEKGLANVAAALEGARWIAIERFSEDAALIGALRRHLWDHAELTSRVIEGRQEEGAKFSDYFSARERFRTIPSHRALALLRGRKDGVLRLGLALPDEEPSAPELMISRRFGIPMQARAADPPGEPWRRETVRVAWAVRLRDHLETELIGTVREAAEQEAIRVFGRNLRDLLLAAPAGARPTLGLDPGLRTGVKAAAIDATGKVVATATIHPHAPRHDWEGSIAVLAELARRHGIELISIGNGTASRETDRLAADLLARYPDIKAHKVVVSEAGASVYSASALAAKEFPDLDVSLRGAVSIARRLQDPLAELVKIEPKAIGVGQYQHDVSQAALARTLDATVEDCVNAVGADVNTSSPALLARVSGLNARLATGLVAYRDEHGPFRSRAQLRHVPRFGDRTFELAAGFLRIPGGDNPLDASGVHPESYPVVQRIVAATGRSVGSLIGDAALLRSLQPERFTDDRVGAPTVKDIIAELEKPGRDPRPAFKTAAFRDGVEALTDLRPGMTLEGVVTNVTNFGAFVDVGVHQDGLVHVSQLAERFVKDPRDVVKAGDIVAVTVLEVDLTRRRVGLSMRAGQRGPREPGVAGAAPTPRSPRPAAAAGPSQAAARPSPQTSMAAAFRSLRDEK